MSGRDTIVQNDNCHLEDTQFQRVDWMWRKKKSSVIRVIFSYFLVFSKEQGKNKEGGEAEKDWNGGKRGRVDMEEVEWRKYGEPW